MANVVLEVDEGTVDTVTISNTSVSTASEPVYAKITSGAGVVTDVGNGTGDAAGVAFTIDCSWAGLVPAGVYNFEVLKDPGGANQRNILKDTWIVRVRPVHGA